MLGDFDRRPRVKCGSVETKSLRCKLGRLRGLIKDRRANVYVIFALTAPVLLVMIGAGIDYSFAFGSKRTLQDATDAATLAVSAAVAKNPNTTEPTLQTLAQNVLNADFPQAPTIKEFHVCAPVQADCTSSAGSMANDTVLLSTSATAPCTMSALVPLICNASAGAAQKISVSTSTVIGFGANMQLNLVLDTSASMIVGATPSDVTLIANWMSYSTTTTTCDKHGQNCVTTTDYPNWNAMMPNDPGPAFSGDNPQCAFACHDLGGSTTSANIAEGLANAHTANATTRFDVMIAAGEQLLNHVQAETSSSTVLAKNIYKFNIYSFDTTLHKWGSSNMDNTTALGVFTGNQIQPGLDTYIDNSMSTLASNSYVGHNGNGSSTASPLKFVMLVTDGLQSDRNNNWGCTWTNSTAWGALTDDRGQPQQTCKPSTGFDKPMNTANCTTMKNNGIVVAVLETPYVPLSGEDQHVLPYERTVQATIYPGGPNTASTVSAALQACATTGYYFQASNASDIATGFISLTDKFLSQSSYLSH
jgi:Flp pilus assembly protein TadG